MSAELIYLDNNSTTRIDPRVAQCLALALGEQHVNPASQHQLGQRSRRSLEEARLGCLQLLDADWKSFPADQLIFTSGGTEANNQVILGYARPRQQLIVSAIEHPSVMLAAQHAAATIDANLLFLPVTSDGVIRLDVLSDYLRRAPTSLVSVMLVNNETGVIQPVREAAQLCRQHGVLIHTDAVQALGKIPVSFRGLDVDFLTFTPHKFHGPRGIGGLVIRSGSNLPSLLYGGFQQASLRPGTEDVALTVACRYALELALAELPVWGARWLDYRALFLSVLSSRCRGPFVVHGAAAERVPQTINVSFPGVERQALLIAADVAGIAVSTGSACSSGSSEPSPVLLGMGLATELVESSIRVSFGRDTTEDDVRIGAEKLAELSDLLRGC